MNEEDLLRAIVKARPILIDNKMSYANTPGDPERARYYAIGVVSEALSLAEQAASHLYAYKARIAHLEKHYDNLLNGVLNDSNRHLIG